MKPEGPLAPTVSVIVPTYQRRERIKRAVASVLAQTFRDFELIVIDDGSTDGTGEALAPLGARLRYEWRENRGVAAARNAGIAIARAPIVAFLDSDNRWTPDHLAVITEMLDRQPEAILASTCPSFALTGNEQARDTRLVDRGAGPTRSDRVGFLSCVAVRREALVAVGGFDERLKALEDTDLWARLAVVGPFAVVRRRTLVRGVTRGSLSDRARRSGHSLQAAEITAGNLSVLAEKLSEPERSELGRRARGALHLARMQHALDRGDDASVAAELERACRHLPLSDTPGLLHSRLEYHLPRGHEPEERLRMFATLAEAWPDPDAAAARHMRAFALGWALRLRRPRAAAGLLAGWPRRGNLDFGRRLARFLWAMAKRAHHDRRRREHEGPALDPGHLGIAAVNGHGAGSSNARVAPAVSVIVPTFQRRELVRRAVASVLTQTFRDYELIVVDDGSTDGTGEALAPVGDRLLYRWQEHTGVSAARNHGLELARGSIVAFLDSDDRWLPDHLATVTAALGAHPQAVLVTTCAEFTTAGRAAVRDAVLHDHRDWLMDAAASGFPSCIAVRRDALLAVGGFDERMRAGEDTDLLIRLVRCGPFLRLARRTIRQQMTTGSLIDRARRAGVYLEDTKAAAERLAAELEGHEDADHRATAVQAKSIGRLVDATRALSEGDEPAARTALAEACRALPRLSAEAGPVTGRLRQHSPTYHNVDARLGILRRATAAWPEPRSDVARYLRALATLTALRAGRPGVAVRLAAEWPMGGNLGFARRIAPVAAKRIRRVTRERLQRGAEPEALLAAPWPEPAAAPRGLAQTVDA